MQRVPYLLPLLLAGLLAAAPAWAQPCTVTWTNALGGDWNTGSNWSTGSAPSPADDACVTLDGDYTVSHTSGGAIDVNSFTFGAASGTQTLDTSRGIVIASASTVGGNGRVEWSEGFLSGGATLTTAGEIVLDGVNFNTRGINGATTVLRTEGSVVWEREEFTLRDGGVWQNAGTLTAVLTVTSAELRQDGTGTALFDNTGTVTVEAGTLFLRSDALHDGTTLAAGTGAVLRLDAGTHTFAGTTTGAPDGAVILSAASVAEAGASWNLGGEGMQWQTGFLNAGTLTNDGLVVLNGVNFNTRGINGATTEFVNAGDVRWEREEFTLFDGGIWTNTGTLTVDAVTSSVDLRRGGTGTSFFDNAGIVSVDTSRFDVNVPFTHQAGALIQGTDDFDILGSTFTHDGNTGPGTSPGLLTWTGPWAPASGSTLFIELGGTTPGDDYDQLAVSGAATLAGTLDLSIAVGDAPGIGDTFTVLTATGGVTGTFDSIQPAFGYTFDVTVNANEVEVEVLTVPNFDLVAVNTNPSGSPIMVEKPGSIRFAYSVTNNTSAPITGDVFYTAEVNGNVLAQGRILSGTLPANSSSPALSYTQPVPGLAPNGTYTYTIKIGQFPNVVVDSEAFTVVVTSGARMAEGEETWAVREATPWLAADGTVLMAVAEQAETNVTEDLTEAASVTTPETFGLAAAYPNPFRSETTFALDVPETSRVTMSVYDALGRRVAVLLDGEVEAGTHRVAFDASSLPSGFYLVRATGASATAMQRVTLVR